MAQKINLNSSPYYDDFDSEKNFHRVLYKPGFPVQARELTTQQSILQNQVEKFGDHIFKDGSVVIPGGIAFDNQYNAVKLNSLNLNVDISVYNFACLCSWLRQSSKFDNRYSECVCHSCLWSGRSFHGFQCV